MVESAALPEAGEPEAELTQAEIASLLAANEPTARTQRARLAALKGKHMLFVAGDFIYPACAGFLCEHLKKLRSHGLRITAVFQEGKQSGAYYTSCRPCVDAELFADVGCADGAQRITEAVRGAGIADALTGVWSPHEAVVTVVSQTAKLLSLPGNPPEAYETARDKFKTREKLLEQKVPSIQAVQVWSAADADKAAQAIGFPMIVKPTSGMGSAGVYRVDNEAELTPTLQRVFSDIDSSYALKQKGSAKQAPVIAETCVVPTIYGGRINEFDVEVLLWKGQLVYANVIDNLESLPHTYQELGSISPSLAPREVLDALIVYAADATRALGFHTGGFHVEVWNTPSGPILIEVNARVGGGATVDTHINVYDVNPMLEFTLAFLDIPINPPRPALPLCTYGYILPNAQVTGVIAAGADFLEDARASPMFRSLAYFKKAGDKVQGLDSRLPDWTGEVHLRHEGAPEDVLLEMDALLQTIHAKSLLQTEQPQTEPDRAERAAQQEEASAVPAANPATAPEPQNS